MERTEEKNNNYVSNSFWLLLEKSSRIISGILVGVLVLRYLGDTQFGIISYGLGIIGMLTIFSTLGLDNLIVRELLTRKDDKNTILGTAFALRFAGSFVVVAGSCAYSLLRDPLSTTWIVFLLSISIVFQSLTVIDFYFQSQVKGKLNAINQVITLSVSAAIKIGLILCHASLEWFATMAALEAGITALNQWIFYHREGELMKRWKFSSKEARYLLILALPIILSSFIQMFTQNADTILIARFLRNMGMVGQYTAGIRMSQASFFIPVAIAAAVFPGIINNRDNPELQKKRLTQLYSLMFWAAFIIIIGSQLFGQAVITFLYGSKFPDAPLIFRIHVISILPVFWGTVWGYWMLAQQRQKYIVWMQILNALVIISGLFYLIPRYGIQGAAWAVVAGGYVSFSYMILVWRPVENIKMLISALHPGNIMSVIRYWKG